MKSAIFTTIIILIILLFNFPRKQVKHKFLLAGHSYGHPLEKTLGLFEPFNDYLKNSKQDFVVLLGDFVRSSNLISFNAVKKDIKQRGLNAYFVPGNHDLDNEILYKEEIGETFYSFNIKGDNFIVLDGTKDAWNIKGEQLQLLKKVLSESTGNVFILVHQVLWWDSNNKYRNLVLNSKAHRSPTINFWNEVIPLLKSYNGDIFICAGDIGASKVITNPFYDKFDNITLLATGMGARYRDNCLEVTVFEDNDVDIKVVSLIEGLNFDDIEDYKLE